MKPQQIAKTNQPNNRGETQSPAKPALFARAPLHPLMQLQQTLGNRAVGRFIQAKLKINQPGDIYEQEADRVAEQVMRMPEPVSFENSPPTLQRKCAACASGHGLCPNCAEEENLVQRKPLASKITPVVQRQITEAPESIPGISPSVENHINNLSDGGQPLPKSVRAFFEPRFGYDFSQVRVHIDTQAAKSARAVNALAYTIGRNVVFGVGQYAPNALAGRELLAHELTHVIQQAGSTFALQRQENYAGLVCEPLPPEEEGQLICEEPGGEELICYAPETEPAPEVCVPLEEAEEITAIPSTGGQASTTCALTTFRASNFVGDTVTADVGFVDSLTKINEHAVANNVEVYVTDSFRKAGEKVTGAIVKPAKMSNHLVGHAIDMNVKYGENKKQLCNSTCLKGRLPKGVSGFIKAIRDDPALRWGGDFGEIDPVHIDDGLNTDKKAWGERFKATQEARKKGCG